ncbi:MAG: VWA domain-containing protein [Acidimicrobiales bacterium]|nr:VWA domain-containing protein [Acidimicrobiales bacterium]MCB9393914.1 VWA domain-containing protein [Acidimicrobiaceae bacterium]
MSEIGSPHAAQAPTSEVRTTRDAGLTLVELIVTVMLLGLVVSSLTAAVIVMVREQDNSAGRLNVARSETSVATWLPGDLASAETVDVSAGASPCGTSCPASAVTGGSNAIMLSWTSLEAGRTDAVVSQINVSYRYVQQGDSYDLVRVQCLRVGGAPWTCENLVVIRDMLPPPGDVTFVPGSTSPSWVLQVSQPPADDPADPLDPLAPSKVARQVVITLDGGGDTDGAGGGLNTLTLTSGGSTRSVIDASSTSGTPTFNQARTRCGGNYGLVLDDSGSIGGAMSTVIDGAIAFVEAFAGTPVKLQVVRFDSAASVVGESPRSRYYDMLVERDVDDLRRELKKLKANGATNWEDALHRMFYTETGTVQQVLPDTVLFFTDGEPTWSRLDDTSSRSAPTSTPPRQVELATSGSSYDQEAFNRAKYIVDQFRGTVDFIGVGVGPAFGNSNNWLDYGRGWHYDYERGFHYERRSGSSWNVVDQATYDATAAASRRIRYSAPYQYWEPTTKAVYDSTASAGRRRTTSYSEPYESYDIVTTRTRNSVILTRLITGNDFGEPAVSVNGEFVNADTANMYLLPDWDQFAAALESVALAECGGTITIQTRLGGAAVPDPFEYQHTATTDRSGLPLQASKDIVRTTRTYPSGTFDFALEGGEWITVEIQPLVPASTLYSDAGWSCAAGGKAKAIETFAVEGGPWSGVRVQVRPNEAVSCVMQVNR